MQSLPLLQRHLQPNMKLQIGCILIRSSSHVPARAWCNSMFSLHCSGEVPRPKNVVILRSVQFILQPNQIYLFRWTSLKKGAVHVNISSAVRQPRLSGSVADSRARQYHVVKTICSLRVSTRPSTAASTASQWRRRCGRSCTLSPLCRFMSHTHVYISFLPSAASTASRWRLRCG